MIDFLNAQGKLARGAAKDKLLLQENAITERLKVMHRELVVENARRAAEENRESLNSVCRMASTMLRAPAAIISAVTSDRQEWLASAGAVPAAPQIQPLTNSMCKYVVATEEPFAVCDAADDPVVQNSPAYIEDGIRSYLGVPVWDHEHTAVIGALCVFQPTARDWEEREAEILEELAETVVLV